jgi:hypothetical protein
VKAEEVDESIVKLENFDASYEDIPLKSDASGRPVVMLEKTVQDELDVIKLINLEHNYSLGHVLSSTNPSGKREKLDDYE